MPIFHTHVATQGGVAEDDEGQEFEGLAQACEAAFRASNGLLADAVRAGATELSFEFWIDDEFGVRLASLPFSVKVTRPSAISGFITRTDA